MNERAVSRVAYARLVQPGMPPTPRLPVSYGVRQTLQDMRNAEGEGLTFTCAGLLYTAWRQLVNLVTTGSVTRVVYRWS